MDGGTVTITFKGNDKDLQKKVNSVKADLTDSLGSVKNIVAGMGITQLIGQAFNALNNNLDGAISRYDTIQNFPKVMKNFGVSADEASKSINRIADSVLGLPTSLDQAVAGVQDIFMVTKDLKKAENMFQAVNDAAMVFANGSTQSVNLFIYAYKQAMAQGKMFAGDFNQMNSAIPGIMDKVAESMGITFAELKEGLSKGGISMEQFNSTLQKLDTEGVGTMGAMRDAAFDATGGIKTAMTNMNSRISAGLAEMIDAVNKGLKEAGLGNLATIFSNLGSTIKNVLVSLAPYITTIIVFLNTELPKIVETIRTVIPYLEGIGIIILGWKIGKTIQGIVQGFQTAKLALALFSMEANGTTIAQAALNGTLKASEVITALLTGKLTLLQLAQAGVAKVQTVLNAVMAANPIALTVLAIAALIAIFVVLWNKCEGFRNFWIGLWEGIKNTAFSVIEWFKSIPESIGNVVNSIINFLSNLPYYFGYMIGFIAGTIYKFWTEDVPNFVNGVIQWFSELPSKLSNIFTDTIHKVGQWLSDMRNKVKTEVPKLISNIVSWFRELPGKMLEIGHNIVSGIWNGIQNAKNWLKSKVKDFAKGILDGVKDALGIHSPSTQFAIIGKYSILGYTEALDDMKSNVQNTIDDVFGIDPTMYNNASTHLSPNINMTVVNNMDFDPIGQVVNRVKTYSGGSKNDYNYGQGAN